MPRSAIRTVTPGCCRKSPPACPDAWTRTTQYSLRRPNSRGRSAARKPRTANTKNGPACGMQTGRTGTPSSWWQSRPARSCRSKPGTRRSDRSNRILVFYGSYRSDGMGIRLAQFVVNRLRRRGDDVELIDAKAIDLPMLDRMYKEYAKGAAPEPLERLARKIRDADGFVFVTGEYNWGVQPGLKNLTDHFLEEWFWRPAAIASYSGGRLSGVRAATAWHGILSEMGMVVVSSTIAVGPIGQTLSSEGEPVGESGAALERAFLRFADDLLWWVEAAKAQRQRKVQPY